MMLIPRNGGRPGASGGTRGFCEYASPRKMCESAGMPGEVVDTLAGGLSQAGAAEEAKVLRGGKSKSRELAEGNSRRG